MSTDATQVEQAQQIQSQPQRASATTWLNRAFVVVVLVAIPLVYYFGYISHEWLNRVGIILNFCAGFMVAPELLGVYRIQKVEVYIEHLFSRTPAFFTRIGTDIKNNIGDIDSDLVVGLIACAILPVAAFTGYFATGDFKFIVYGCIIITVLYLIGIIASNKDEIAQIYNYKSRKYKIRAFSTIMLDLM